MAEIQRTSPPSMDASARRASLATLQELNAALTARSAAFAFLAPAPR
ncbi:MAG: hypothetical protein IPG17_30575 [Sandaracinaceae bacterium]|nr:hypothetical protein [Sandaracinaceae bacterium]